MNALPSTLMAPKIATREELDALLENIASLHRTRGELRVEQEKEINEVRLRYRAPLSELENLLALETSWAEAWGRANRHAFASDGTLVGGPATLGFRAETPRVERASRRWTWSRIAQTLGNLAWGPRYLRTPAPEVDQAALTADLESLSREELRAAGMVVVQGEHFFITPHPVADNSAWPAAA